MTVGFITGTGSGLGAGGGGGGGGLSKTWHLLAISRMSGFFLGFVACMTSPTVSSRPSSRPFLRYSGLCFNRIYKLSSAYRKFCWLPKINYFDRDHWLKVPPF